MELRVLNYFLAVAREGNFTRAAEQLHVTQPTLSRQISALEAELNTKLFVRSNHNVKLTEDGLLLKRRAQEIINLADATKRDFLINTESLEGDIIIGSGEFASTKVLCDCIAAFRKRHAHVHFELYSGNTENITDGIERGVIHAGVMNEPVNPKKYSFVSMPVSEEWGVYVRKSSPLASLESVRPKNFDGMNLIATTGSLAQGNLQKWLGVYAGKVNIIARGNLLYNEAMLAQSLDAAMVGIRLSCCYSGFKFLPFSPKFETSTALAWKRNYAFSPAASAFLSFAQAYILGITNN